MYVCGGKFNGPKGTKVPQQFHHIFKRVMCFPLAIPLILRKSFVLGNAAFI